MDGKLVRLRAYEKSDLDAVMKWVNDEEITDERIQERSRQVQKQIEAVRKAREVYEKLDQKLADTPRGATTRDKRKYRRARWAAMRSI